MGRLWLFSQTRLGLAHASGGKCKGGFPPRKAPEAVCTNERVPRRTLLSAGVGSAEDEGAPCARQGVAP